MKTKLFMWAFVVFVILCVEQVYLQIEQPAAATSMGLEQMRGVALYSSGFTFLDMLKNSMAIGICALWTVCLFWNDVVRAGYRLVSKITSRTERGLD